MSQLKITFLGLGAMGYPMAGHLANDGHKVTVYNRTTSVAGKWLTEYSGEMASSPSDAVKDADFIITMVGNDDHVRQIYAEIFKGAKSGTVLIDHTTTSAIVSKEMYQLAKDKGMSFLDAPVSGGEAGAINGALTIMVGGDQQTFDTALPVMNTYTKATTRIGESGQGQVLKMINQVCIAGLLQGLSEAWLLAKASGIEAKTIVDVLQHGAAGSWQMVNRTETAMNNDFDHGFAIDWMRKDLAICFEEANKLGIDLPLSKQVDDEYRKLQERGYARADTSVLFKQFDEESR